MYSRNIRTPPPFPHSSVDVDPMLVPIPKLPLSAWGQAKVVRQSIWDEKKMLKGGGGSPPSWDILPYSQVEFGYNPKLGGNHNYGGNQEMNQPYIKWIKAHPWMQPFGGYAKDHPEPTETVYDLIKLGDIINKEKDMVKKKILTDQYSAIKSSMDAPNIALNKDYQTQWLQGNDDTQRAINHYGRRDYLWQESLNPDHLLTYDRTKTPTQLGSAWCIIYNRSWQDDSKDSNKWDEAWDAVKTGLEIGKTIAELVV